MKNPLTLAGIEPANFRFVAQHLNHCVDTVRQWNHVCIFCANHTEFLHVIEITLVEMTSELGRGSTSIDAYRGMTNLITIYLIIIVYVTVFIHRNIGPTVWFQAWLPHRGFSTPIHSVPHLVFPIVRHLFSLGHLFSFRLACISWGFLSKGVIHGEGVSLTPKHRQVDQTSVFLSPVDRKVQLYLQTLGIHFRSLVRRAWATLGPFFSRPPPGKRYSLLD